MRRPGSGIWVCSVLACLAATSSVCSQTVPVDLPRYDMKVDLDTGEGMVKVREIVTWTNRTRIATSQLVFNAHARYSIPDKDIGFIAKTAEFLRMMPKEALSFDGPALHMQKVLYRPRTAPAPVEPREPTKPFARDNNGAPLPPPPALLAPVPAPAAAPVAFQFLADNPTALTITLPAEVRPGESVTVELEFNVKLPPRKGRWGQWDGITTLAQWIPVVAILDETKGWQPAPFIPWHQPFHNDAGHYTVRIRVPADQKVAASAPVKEEREVKGGFKEIEFEPVCVRDFALIASARFQEWTAEADGVKIRVLAAPEHEFYAKVFADTVRDAIPVYNRWFGKYPYKQFTIAEACFGWNGNECGALVMIDDRMFNMPHIAKNYPIQLVQHELAHQWWYNVVGTNGYLETWMDEGLATHFSHRLADRTIGRNNKVIDFPPYLDWVTNIRRDDLRNYGMIGAWARGEARPTVPAAGMPGFGHLVNLMSATYDRGSKVVGMIEERLGEEAFLEFMRGVYRKYGFRILLVADFQRELETFTGRSWQDFFQHWVYGSGRCDWAIEKVEIDGRRLPLVRLAALGQRPDRVKVVVHVRQQGEFNEPTTLGIRLQEGEEYQVRLPIQPDVQALRLDDVKAAVYSTIEDKNGKPGAIVRVEIELPSEPVQITVDPDRILVDERPTNNYWKQPIRWHLTPVYTQLDEVDVSNAYDRWNVNVGPWAYLATYNDPWYTRSDMLGFRMGVYRTQEVSAGGYVAYRTNDRTIVAGADMLWDHVGLPNVQVGMNVERAFGSLSNDGVFNNRGVIFGRYIMMYGSSLYQLPFEFVEAFAMMQDRPLPTLRESAPGADPLTQRPTLGLSYHKNLLTPYWDAEGGYSCDISYQHGLSIFGNGEQLEEVYGQFTVVKSMPKLLETFHDGPMLRWLYDTRFVFHVAGATGLPRDGLLFSLGGQNWFRGFDLSERQGSTTWVGNVEWRVPVATNLHWDFFDHIAGVRNLFLIPFYDIGNAYIRGRELAPTAEAVGVGFGVDVTWLGLIERTILRVDVAKTINANAPVQFWLGLSHPF